MNSNVLPSGFTYNDVEDIIERISDKKARKYGNVGFYDLDDLKQEARIKCWSILGRYNVNHGTELEAYLGICIENRIRDIKRSIVYKHNKPCFQCPFWQQDAASSGAHDCLVFDNKMECEKYARHEKYVQIKLSSSHPIDIDNERIEDGKYANTINGEELYDYVIKHLPSGHRHCFDKLANNNFNLKSLKKNEVKAIVSELKKIMSNFGE